MFSSWSKMQMRLWLLLRKIDRVLIAATVLGVAVIVSPEKCSEDAPPDLAPLIANGDVEGVYDLIEHVFRGQLGKQFPEVQLVDQRGKTRTIGEFRGQRVLLFYAGGSCPMTLAKLDELRRAGWKVPDETLLIVLKYFGMREMKKPLDGAPRVYEFLPFPPPGYLNYLRVYPTYFHVDGNGVLVGVQLGSRPLISASQSEAAGGLP